MNLAPQPIEHRLGHALHEVAASVHVDAPLRVPTPVPEPRPRHGFARAAIATAAAAVLVIAVVAVAIAANSGTEPARVDTSGAPAGRAPREIDPDPHFSNEADVAVYMRVHATPDEITGVRRAIEGSGAVSRFAHFDNDAAYRQFRKIFADDPDLTQNVGPDALPQSFLVFTRSCAVRRPLMRQLKQLPGVEDIVLALGLSREDARREQRDLDGKSAWGRCDKRRER